LILVRQFIKLQKLGEFEKKTKTHRNEMRSFTRAQQMTKATLDLSPIRHSILGPKMSGFIP